MGNLHSIINWDLLMKRRSIISSIALAILLMACSFSDAQAQETTSFVSEVEVTDEAVTFKTKGGAFEGITMTVAGPDDFWYQKTFSGREMPSLPVKTAKGALPDGSYVIELSARPKLSDKDRNMLEEARQKGDRYTLNKVRKEVGLNPSMMAYTTNVGVMRGVFISPSAEEPESEGGKGEGASFGAADTPDGTPSFGSVRLTGRRWDAAYLPNTPDGYVAPPDVTGTAVQPAALAVEASGAAPPFLQTSPDPAAAWYEASFHNTAPDGTPLAYQGFLRPVAADGEGRLFEVYLRTDGAVDEPWVQGFFRANEGGFRVANHAHEPFDYLTEESPDDAQASMPTWHTGAGSIDGSLCVGFDCPSTPAFGFDTIRMQENNLRLHFEDTSTTASFPPNDWRVYANDSANGGSSYFGVEDATAGRFVFRVFAGARSNALTVDSQGDVGLGTTTPATDIDIKIGDTPTVRLQQDGTSGFTPQTWDVAGNEAGFFIRDATGGSQLPLRIRVGAPTSSIDVAASGNVGIGETSPDEAVHITRSGSSLPRIVLENGDANTGFGNWQVDVSDNADFRISVDGSGSQELVLTETGDLTILGDCTETDGACADYVFEEDYEMLTLEELQAYILANKHLPNVPTAAEIMENGIVVQDHMGVLLEKIEELVLYTLEQQQTIEQQQQTIEAIMARLAALEGARADDQR